MGRAPFALILLRRHGLTAATIFCYTRYVNLPIRQRLWIRQPSQQQSQPPNHCFSLKHGKGIERRSGLECLNSKLASFDCSSQKLAEELAGVTLALACFSKLLAGGWNRLTPPPQAQLPSWTCQIWEYNIYLDLQNPKIFWSMWFVLLYCDDQLKSGRAHTIQQRVVVHGHTLPSPWPLDD